MLLRRRFTPTTESKQELPPSKKTKTETEIAPERTALNETTRKDASPTKPVILTPPRTSEESDTGSEGSDSDDQDKLSYLKRLNHNTPGSAKQLMDYALTPYNPKSRSVLPYLFASSPDHSDGSDTDENSSPNLSLSKAALPVTKSSSTPH